MQCCNNALIWGGGGGGWWSVDVVGCVVPPVLTFFIARPLSPVHGKGVPIVPAM